MANIWKALPTILVAFLSAEAQATSCVRAPLTDVIEHADAIFVGRVTSVEYHDLFELEPYCKTHGDGPRCGAKVARVTVERVWKGDVDEETFVYSEDGCHCLGGYFSEGDERMFMVVRDDEWRLGLGHSDYRTAGCGRNYTVQQARDDGIIDSLDEYFSDAR